jgi:putative lipoprotein
MRPILMSASIAIALSAATLTGCANAPSASDPATMTTVDVTATYRERIRLSPGHVLTVTLSDVSLADAPSRQLAEHKQVLADRSPPYAVTLSVPSAQIMPRHQYAVRAEIRDPDGALRFTTDTRYSVLTHGSGNRADIVMIGVPRP